MIDYSEIDRFFGPPVPMTLKGKLMNIPAGYYVLGGVLIFVLAVGFITISKRSYKFVIKSEDQKPPTDG